MAITELSPAISVTCEAIYVPFVDGADVDNAPEFQQLVCDVVFQPNTKEDGIILVAGTAKGIIASTFTFPNVGDPAGTYPWPFDEQIVNLADTDLNPSGANYTVIIKPKGYVSATNTVVALEGWADRVGVLVCESGMTTTPLLQWLPLETASGGEAVLIGPPGPPGPTAVSTDVGNVAVLGTDGKIFVPAGASVNATTTVKGVLKLAGDLGGTADLPTVPGLSSRVPTTRTIAAGTGLTGGGDLSANRSLAVSYGTTAGTAAQGNDSRIVNAVPNTRTVNSKALSDNITLSATDVGAAPALGADDNYVTDAEKTKLANLSGTNTGDQVLPTWSTLSGKPAIIAAGATAADARAAIEAGTSSFSGSYTDLSNKPIIPGTEEIQDIVGTMVTGAGGTYNDTAGTITLPSGGSATTTSLVSLTHSESQSVVGATLTELLWTLETIDTDGYHDVSVNTGRVTIPTGLGGVFMIVLKATFFANNTGAWRAVQVKKNGTTVLIDTGVNRRSNESAGSNPTDVFATLIVNLADGDYLQAFVWHDANAAANLSGTNKCVFTVTRIGA